MKKIIFTASLVLLSACSSTPKSALNCEKLHADSEVRLQELRHIFSSYQGINYDLALKLAPPLKEEVAELDARVRKQKMKCWPKEKREIDQNMALLREELFKVYAKPEELPNLQASVAKKKSRAPASENSEFIESVELDSE